MLRSESLSRVCTDVRGCLMTVGKQGFDTSRYAYIYYRRSKAYLGRGLGMLLLGGSRPSLPINEAQMMDKQCGMTVTEMWSKVQSFLASCGVAGPAGLTRSRASRPNHCILPPARPHCLLFAHTLSRRDGWLQPCLCPGPFWVLLIQALATESTSMTTTILLHGRTHTFNRDLAVNVAGCPHPHSDGPGCSSTSTLTSPLQGRRDITKGPAHAAVAPVPVAWAGAVLGRNFRSTTIS
jgi:hypothetical protein